jgi:hypothetical protein
LNNNNKRKQQIDIQSIMQRALVCRAVLSSATLQRAPLWTRARLLSAAEKKPQEESEESLVDTIDGAVAKGMDLGGEVVTQGAKLGVG